MFRREVRTILCPSCGRLTRAEAAECSICGRRRPGLWGFTSLARRLFRAGSVTQVITVACIALYVASLVLDPAAAFTRQGPFDILSPSLRALRALGTTGSWAWHRGEWWTLLTAIYLHGGVLHILFNVLWIRQLGPAVEDVYGPARYMIIFTVGGVAGFVLSNAVGDFVPSFAVPYTVGASGAIFGLFGAMVAFGRKRGGVFRTLILRQYGQWALVLFILGFLMAGVNNWGHARGFVGGLLCGLVLPAAERRPEGTLDHVAAGGLVVLTLVSFGLALWTAFA